MRIYQLEIKGFRGIKEGVFNFTTPLVCLIGHGDTTKTTILDAIEYILSPNWFIPIDDSDFTNCDPSIIEMIATIGPVPDEFMSDSKYGQYLRKWNIHDKKLFDDDVDEFKKDDGSIYVLSIKISIDKNLTPEWFVITDAHPEGVHIPYKDRQKIGVSRIGENIDNELAWTRGSSLLRLSQDKNEMEKILLDANRKLRDMLSPEDFNSLEESINMAKTSGQAYGINTDDFRANIDPKVLKGTSSTLSLHDKKIPFRRMGIGTRRLMAIGLQLGCIEKKGGILLIDEIEYALEPHRLKYLLRILSKNTKEQGYGQIFMTTQYPATLEELGAESLYCVHYKNKEKKTEIKKIDKEIQGTVRRIPEAFLSPKVIICEGPTEIGLLRAYENYLIKTNNDKCSFAYKKIAVINGEGTSASQRAYDLAACEYSTCLFVDSDRLDKWKVSESKLIGKSVFIIRWQDGNNTEMQLFSDLPKNNIKSVVDIVIKEEDIDEQSILQSINSGLKTKLTTLEGISSYPDEDLPTLRISVARSAKDNNWFKNITTGEALGEYLFNEILEEIKTTEFYKTFEKVKKWAINEQ